MHGLTDDRMFLEEETNSLFVHVIHKQMMEPKVRLPVEMQSSILSFLNPHGASPLRLQKQYRKMRKRQAQLVATCCRLMGYHSFLRSTKFELYADPCKLCFFWSGKWFVARYVASQTNDTSYSFLTVSIKEQTKDGFLLRCRRCSFHGCYLHGEVRQNQHVEKNMVAFYMDHYWDVSHHSRDLFTNKCYSYLKRNE